MFNSNTNQEWEKFGKIDPYFGVLTQDRFRVKNLTEDAKTDFFLSGNEYINKVLYNIQKHIDSSFIPKKVLDFGCGVGRLVIPLAKASEHVFGVDISNSMLLEAKKNCEVANVENVTFLISDDNLNQLDQKFNLIHSFIVFQHIPVHRGELIFRNLFRFLEDGGIFVLHFTFDEPRSRRSVSWIKNYVPFVANITNLLRRGNLFAPTMQIYCYDLNRLFYIIQQHNIHDFYAEFTDSNGELGIILYFKKPG
jgi:2-polyprenyl-3-methyl-5-hydroxy-6-metoxy-1,4-benzoquinol methylase